MNSSSNQLLKFIIQPICLPCCRHESMSMARRLIEQVSPWPCAVYYFIFSYFTIDTILSTITTHSNDYISFFHSFFSPFSLHIANGKNYHITYRQATWIFYHYIRYSVDVLNILPSPFPFLPHLHFCEGSKTIFVFQTMTFTKWFFIFERETAKNKIFQLNLFDDLEQSYNNATQI